MKEDVSVGKHMLQHIQLSSNVAVSKTNWNYPCDVWILYGICKYLVEGL